MRTQSPTRSGDRILDRHADRYPRQAEEEWPKRADQTGCRSRGRKRGVEESGKDEEVGEPNRESQKTYPTKTASHHSDGNMGRNEGIFLSKSQTGKEGINVGIMKEQFEFQFTRTKEHGKFSLEGKNQEVFKRHMLADLSPYSNRRLTTKGTWQAREDMNSDTQPQ